MSQVITENKTSSFLHKNKIHMDQIIQLKKKSLKTEKPKELGITRTSPFIPGQVFPSTEAQSFTLSFPSPRSLLVPLNAS